MGWMETCAVDERMRFVMAVEREEESFAALCRRFQVSRKTGYKWVERYEEAGLAVWMSARGRRAIIRKRCRRRSRSSAFRCGASIRPGDR